MERSLLIDPSLKPTNNKHAQFVAQRVYLKVLEQCYYHLLNMWLPTLCITSLFLADLCLWLEELLEEWLEQV